MRVPKSQLLGVWFARTGPLIPAGALHGGFYQLMEQLPQERLCLAGLAGPQNACISAADACSGGVRGGV